LVGDLDGCSAARPRRSGRWRGRPTGRRPRRAARRGGCDLGPPTSAPAAPLHDLVGLGRAARARIRPKGVLSAEVPSRGGPAVCRAQFGRETSRRAARPAPREVIAPPPPAAAPRTRARHAPRPPSAPPAGGRRGPPLPTARPANKSSPARRRTPPLRSTAELAPSGRADRPPLPTPTPPAPGAPHGHPRRAPAGRACWLLGRLARPARQPIVRCAPRAGRHLDGSAARGARARRARAPPGRSARRPRTWRRRPPAAPTARRAPRLPRVRVARGLAPARRFGRAPASARRVRAART